MLTVKAIHRRPGVERLDVFECERVEVFTGENGDYLAAYGATKGVEVDGDRRIGLILRGHRSPGDEDDMYDEIYVENAMGKTTHAMRAHYPGE